jgi:glycosyltransferase involved in cell wall biosynthesis
VAGILMVFNDQPVPVRYGASHLVMMAGRHLRAAGHDVHLLFRGWGPITPLLAEQLGRSFTSWTPVYGYRHRKDPLAQAQWYVDALFWQQPIRSDAEEPIATTMAPADIAGGEMCPADLRDAFARALRRHPPDVVWLNYVWLTPLLDLVGAQRPITVIQTHDVLHRRLASYQAHGQRETYDITADDEAELLRQYDLVLAVQDDEARLLRELLPDRRVIICGAAFEVVDRAARDDGRTVCMVASRASHNVHGGQHFINDVWPKVLAACPQARLRVYGNVASALAAHVAPNVELIGPVDDLSDAYAGATVVVNPAYIGSGLKIKTVEAFCHGRPVVTTPLGYAGLSDPNAAVVTGRDEDFARSVVLLLGDAARREQLSRRALAHARRRWTPAAVYRQLDREMGLLLAQRAAEGEPAEQRFAAWRASPVGVE